MPKATLPAAKILALFDAGVTSSAEIARRFGLKTTSVAALLARNNRRQSVDATRCNRRRGAAKTGRIKRALTPDYFDDVDLGAGS